jgi:hypothetical protein
MSLDLGLRGAIVGLSLLLAGVALRDRRDSTVARLGGAATDLTPTEFRRLALAKTASVLPGKSVHSGIGKPD